MESPSDYLRNILSFNPPASLCSDDEPLSAWLARMRSIPNNFWNLTSLGRRASLPPSAGAPALFADLSPVDDSNNHTFSARLMGGTERVNFTLKEGHLLR